MSQSLLKLQIGPVQDFIAQARSTRDLWSGSYLLSWLMATGLRKLADGLGGVEAAQTSVIYPALRGQPLFNFLSEGAASRISRAECLTPNLPNLFVVRLPMDAGQASSLARDIADAIREEWRNITSACWQRLADPKDGVVDAECKARFDRQAKQFLSITWQVTAGGEFYARSYRLNGWQLDAVRQTREFHGWSSGGWQAGKRNNKDSFSGREEAVCGGKEWWKTNILPLQKENPGGFWPTTFRERQASDLYGAISLVKRLWYRQGVYLPEVPWKLCVFDHLKIPSTWQVAQHDPDKNEEDEERPSSPDASGYFAVLAMDGDEMGKWLSGEMSLPLDPDRHQAFSAHLSEFALKQEHARGIVRRHAGCLVYAGGDDVLALLPADTALACARDLRNTFRDVMELGMEASVGIAIAHFKEPLQDVVRAAQEAEKRAKNKGNRATLAVSLFKRSGETIRWHCKWPSDGKAESGLGLFETLREGLAAEKLSAKFPHRITELLSPYLLDPAAEGRHLFQPAEGFDFREIAQREFLHVLGRQRGRNWEATSQAETLAHLAGYLDQLDDFRDADEVPLETNDKVRALIGLCQTVAFVSRNEVD